VVAIYPGAIGVIPSAEPTMEWTTNGSARGLGRRHRLAPGPVRDCPRSRMGATRGRSSMLNTSGARRARPARAGILQQRLSDHDAVRRAGLFAPNGMASNMAGNVRQWTLDGSSPTRIERQVAGDKSRSVVRNPLTDTAPHRYAPRGGRTSATMPTAGGIA
jgi:hypothetical protein